MAKMPTKKMTKMLKVMKMMISVHQCMYILNRPKQIRLNIIYLIRVFLLH